MITTITDLIDKQDVFEVIRDQIGAILATETVSQQALAVAAGKDPELWRFRVFLERANPWESFLDADDKSPIVNVWYDGSSFSKTGSNPIESQKCSGTFNIDCYGYGESAPDGAGHTPGDEQAALNAQRTVRLVRNIIMAGRNTYLQLPRGVVLLKWPNGINIYQPQLGDNPVEKVVGARLPLAIDFVETSPQVEGQAIELVSAEMFHGANGQLLVEADYEYPLAPI